MSADPVKDNVTPLLATEAWKGAVAFAGEQCQGGKRDVRKKTFVRCPHTLGGGYRLYLGEDGLVRCREHDDKFRSEQRTQARKAAAAPNPDQGDLLDGLAYEHEIKQRRDGR